MRGREQGIVSVSILTYHSHNISGNDYPENDHAALVTDIDVLRREGFHFVGLRRIVGAVLGGWQDPLLREKKCVAFTFDDGPIFDFRDFEHSRFGLQKSFRRILSEMKGRHPHDAHELCATSFVIASSAARQCMAMAPECGFSEVTGWLADGWWVDAARYGLLDIGNHSWDHVHPSLPEAAITGDLRGNFGDVRTELDADAQIAMASYYIKLKTAGLAVPFFAYPFGHTSEYLLNEYFPHHQCRHGMTAAFTADGRPVEPDENRWSLPRFVCGYNWRSPDELLKMLLD